MKGNAKFSRRLLMKSLAATSGAAAAAQLTGGSLIGNAFAQTAEKSALLVVYLSGGYNAVFPSAGSFLSNGFFGTSQNSVYNVPNSNLMVDQTMRAGLPEYALTHMATICNLHGSTDHGTGSALNFNVGTRNGGLILANALGGTAAIKAAAIGQRMPPGVRTAEGSVNLQQINDMQATINALGADDPTLPKRDIAAKGLEAAGTMSANYLATAPKSLLTAKEGYAAAVATLKKPAEVFDAQAFRTAYGLQGTTINNFRSKIAAAELMITAGANVAFVTDDGRWDTHGDSSAARVRNMMTSNDQNGILPALNIFCTRMLNKPGRNVVIAITGDFARSFAGSDHAAGVATTVIGKYVKPGQSNAIDNQVRFAGGTPRTQAFWAYLAAVTKAPAAEVQVFGNNDHAALVA